jgi:hypothetical protein
VASSEPYRHEGSASSRGEGLVPGFAPEGPPDGPGVELAVPDGPEATARIATTATAAAARSATTIGNGTRVLDLR